MDNNIKTGSIIVFKRSGLASSILAPILKLFRKDYDLYGWHTAIVVEYTPKGWIIVESLANGVTYNYLKGEYRVYNIIKQEVTTDELRQFIEDHEYKYDILVYLFTALQVIFPKFPRIINRELTCWEFTAWACREFGSPVQPLDKYPLVCDFCGD